MDENSGIQPKTEVMNWDKYLIGFTNYLRLEKSLSENSINAYINDIKKLIRYFEQNNMNFKPDEVTYNHLKNFVAWVNEHSLSASSQARMISGIKSFFKFLLLEDIISSDPTSLLEAPKVGRRLPDVLTTEEIDMLINAIDNNKPEGQRNKAILETLYSCGLRVSELVNLKLEDLSFDAGFIRIKGKGDKERLVPVSKKAVKEISDYLENYRSKMQVMKDSQNIVFLNRRGGKLSRVMVFTIIKNLARKTGLDKNISPHTFRHSFATHLIEGGANLRAVQEMLGHETIITTEIYTHLDREYLRDNILHYHPRS